MKNDEIRRGNKMRMIFGDAHSVPEGTRVTTDVAEYQQKENGCLKGNCYRPMKPD